MLPFLKKNHEAAVASDDIIERKSDEEEHEGSDSLEGAMSELHHALNAKDFAAAAMIFRSAFELLDSEPHEEGEHI